MAEAKEHHSAILGSDLMNMLLDQGVLKKSDKIRRVIIDAPFDGPVTMFIERYGDERCLALDWSAFRGGTRIMTVDQVEQEEHTGVPV